MPTQMTTAERDLRVRLDTAVRRIRSALGRCPAVEDLEFTDIDKAADAAVDVNYALRDALSCTAALEELRNASQEAVLITVTSRMALGIVREVLTVLTAAIDGRRAA